MKTSFVYIMASTTKVLYIGVTSDLEKRVYEHKHNVFEGFTKKYKVHRLVHFEVFGDIREAIYREKQLKKWNREWKIQLINERNPAWEDLAFKKNLDEYVEG